MCVNEWLLLNWNNYFKKHRIFSMREYTIMRKLFVLDKNTWYHIDVIKLPTKEKYKCTKNFMSKYICHCN